MRGGEEGRTRGGEGVGAPEDVVFHVYGAFPGEGMGGLVRIFIYFGRGGLKLSQGKETSISSAVGSKSSSTNEDENEDLPNRKRANKIVRTKAWHPSPLSLSQYRHFMNLWCNDSYD